MLVFYSDEQSPVKTIFIYHVTVYKVDVHGAVYTKT